MLNQLIPCECLPVFPLPGVGLCQQPGGAEPPFPAGMSLSIPLSIPAQHCRALSSASWRPLGGRVSPRWGRELGSAQGLEWDPEDASREWRLCLCQGWAGVGAGVRAGRQGTQRALLLLPEPIIPSPTEPSLGARQEGRAQGHPAVVPARLRGCWGLCSAALLAEHL